MGLRSLALQIPRRQVLAPCRPGQSLAVLKQGDRDDAPATGSQRIVGALILAAGLAGCAGAPSDELQNTRAALSVAKAAPTAILSYGGIVHPVIADGGMVVSQNELATSVGRDILAAGGNAVDAAIATGFALAVTLPRAGNLGGSGFMLVQTASGETVALDFRSAAPAAYLPANYLRSDGSVDTNQLKFGAHVVGVPGTVAGLERRGVVLAACPGLGCLRRPVSLQAKALWSVTTCLWRWHQNKMSLKTLRLAGRNSSTLTATPGLKAPSGKQPDLAATLDTLSREGAESFYKGRIAQALVASVQRDGGSLSLADLERYRVRERTPLETTYRGSVLLLCRL